MFLPVLSEILRVIYPVYILYRWHTRGQRSVDLWNLIAFWTRKIVVSAESIGCRFRTFGSFALFFFSFFSQLLGWFGLWSNDSFGIVLIRAMCSMDFNLCNFSVRLVSTFPLIHFLLDSIQLVSHSGIVWKSWVVLIAWGRKICTSITWWIDSTIWVLRV